VQMSRHALLLQLPSNLIFEMFSLDNNPSQKKLNCFRKDHENKYELKLTLFAEKVLEELDASLPFTIQSESD